MELNLISRRTYPHLSLILTPSERIVLEYIIENSDIGYFVGTFNEMSEHLMMKRQSIVRYVNKLMDKTILIYKSKKIDGVYLGGLEDELRIYIDVDVIYKLIESKH